MSSLIACGGDDEGRGAVDGGSPDVDGSLPMIDGAIAPADGGGGGDPDGGGGGDLDGGGDPDSAVECATGMAGPTCEDCAEGYQDADGDGACLLGCDALGDDALDCGVGGACAVDETSGTRGCTCDDGYEGALCDTCSSGYEADGGGCVLDLPGTTNLSLWLDADATGSLTVSGTAVASWSDRRGSGTPTLSQGTASARPGYVASGRNGRGVVRFDGGDQLFTNSYWGLSTDDYEIIVAAQPIAGSTNGLVSLATGTTSWAVMLDNVGNDYRLIHRNPAGASGGLSVTVDRSTPIGVGWISASHMSSGSIDTIALFASDGATDVSSVMAVTSAGIGSALTLRVGRTADGFMAGDIYEVLIYTRRLTVAERREVTDYLRAKWNLP